MPRLLTIMGSGETSPTMVTVHRRLIDRLGPPPVPAVLLDTPFGFQANADELSAKAVAYFATSVGLDMEVAGLRRVDDGDTVAVERASAGLRRARYAFAGPGSPTYALRQWRGSPVPGVLAEKLERGGAVTFASAAALTLGVVTVPVYEIYKVGAEPHWLEGLDLLALAGLRAAVIPHFDNAEGRNHDTRFCYLGAERLALLEADLPDGAFVLGVDEHTGLVLDLDAGSAEVVGLGVVTVRVDGRSTELPSGTTVGIEELADIAAGRGETGDRSDGGADVAGRVTADATGTGKAASPLLDEVARLQDSFDAAVDRDAGAAAAAALELDEVLVRWASESFAEDEAERGRSALRSMVIRLGELAEEGVRDPAEVVAPFVEALLSVRDAARDARDWSTADAVRDRLLAAGVTINDSPSGTTWSLDR
ncbi:MAG TPA: hypothetical protein VMN58_03965 [Acidimicrobiales bacterium]|nr:hypothetical protein [Acidimicrobiales bacterium]